MTARFRRSSTLPWAAAILVLAVAAYQVSGSVTALLGLAGAPALVLYLATVVYPRLGVGAAGPEIDVDQLAALTIGVVATLTGGLLAFGVAWFGADVDATLLAAGFGILAAALAARYPAATSTRRLVEASVLGLLAFAASNLLVVATTPGNTVMGALAPTVYVVLLAVPIVALIPLGYADTMASPLADYLRIAFTLAPTTFVVAFVPNADGFGAMFFPLLLAAYALGVAVVGLLPYWVGVKLAGARTA